MKYLPGKQTEDKLQSSAASTLNSVFVQSDANKRTETSTDSFSAIIGDLKFQSTTGYNREYDHEVLPLVLDFLLLDFKRRLSFSVVRACI